MIAEAQPLSEILAAPRRRAIRRLAGDYLSLVKPRIMLLLLITEFTTMITAARGWPGLSLSLAALAGGACSAGGASAINCWFDRDIDAVMPRTCTRAVPSGRIQAAHALVFGIGLLVTGFAVLAVEVNLLAATLAVAGGLYYLLVYTFWLKRSTRQNIVIGGAAGAFPPLVGWAAVTGSLSPLAIALFAVVFFWTPPHFWSLALLLRRQYSAVNVPMLPVVAGETSTRHAIVFYSLALLVVSATPALWLGPVYGAASLALGGGMLWLATRVLSTEGTVWAARLFHFSLAYLALLFLSAAAAASLPH